MPVHHLSPQLKQYFTHLNFAYPGFDSPGSVDLLLGADVFSQIMDGKRVVINDCLLTAFSSLFGWIIIGSIEGSSVIPYQSNVVSLMVSLEDIIQQFWHVEGPDGCSDTFTTNDQCEDVFTSERTRDFMGRYVVPIPFLAKHQTETLRVLDR